MKYILIFLLIIIGTFSSNEIKAKCVCGDFVNGLGTFFIWKFDFDMANQNYYLHSPDRSKTWSKENIEYIGINES